MSGDSTDARAEAGVVRAVDETVDWIVEFVMKPHAELGRRGAVCPFMESAMKEGRVSFHTVQIDRPADVERLRDVVGNWLGRIKVAPAAGDDYESALFVPVGRDPDVLLAAVKEVQEDLRDDALARGCMIGNFYPDHEIPGIRNPDFRPLQSPRPVLGIRTMVDTDVLFLAAKQPTPEERVSALATWYRFFGDRASTALLEIYNRSMREATEHQPLPAP